MQCDEWFCLHDFDWFYGFTLLAFFVNKIKIDSKSKQIKITCTFTFHVVVGGGERSRSGGHVTLFQIILTSSTILYWISFIFVTFFCFVLLVRPMPTQNNRLHNV